MRHLTRISTLLSLALASALIASCAGPQAPSYGAAGEGPAKPISAVVLRSEVTWDQLNPARGEKSPKAATLWGDRGGAGPTGFLLKPADGFRSPPHIHNVSYRGVVISGLIHNDDPNAAEMWMPAGSFWTQPQGHVHITAAKGVDALAYIEIEEGPYLVLPVEKAFESGERPVNVDASNIVWADAADITWLHQGETPASAASPAVAFLWGDRRDGRLNGTLVKLPAGFTGTIHSRGSTFGAVVIQGRPRLRAADSSDVAVLDPGGYFGSTGEASRRISTTTTESIIYVRTDGAFEIVAEPLE